MRPGSARSIRTAAAVMTALALGSTGPARGAGSSFDLTKGFVVEVDGAPLEGAKVFSGGRSNLLLDLPGEPTLFLVEMPTGTAFALRGESVVRSKDGTSITIRERFAWSVPLRFETPGTKACFANARSSVCVVERGPEPAADGASTGAPATTATPTQPAPDPAAPDRTDPARAPASAPGPARRSSAPRPDPAPPPDPASPAFHCVALATRPATGVPGCTTVVYIRNVCGVPVQALVQRTEHLMTGTLPQAFEITVPPGEQWLGCSWWSGAMAPAQHQILGAAYLEAPHGRATGRHGGSSRR